MRHSHTPALLAIFVILFSSPALAAALPEQDVPPASAPQQSVGEDNPPAAQPQDTAENAAAGARAPADALAVPERSLPPLQKMVTSPFGNRHMPGWLSRRGMTMRNHSGVDIRARTGWPVVAFKTGSVIHAGNAGLAGTVVDIRQDDHMTARYAHLSKTLVSKGQRVEAGTVVGLVGCTGRTTGAHLHFGLRDASGTLVDPLPLLHSAEQLLRPEPDQIPAVLEPQSCGPVLRGQNGLPMRAGQALKDLDSYSPPPLPSWGQRP